MKILSGSSRPVKPRLPTALLVRRPFISIIYVIDICFLSWRQFDGDFESFHNESETLASGDPQATGKKDTKACIACAVQRQCRDAVPQTVRSSSLDSPLVTKFRSRQEKENLFLDLCLAALLVHDSVQSLGLTQTML